MKLHTNRYGQTIVLHKVIKVSSICPRYERFVSQGFSIIEPYRFVVFFDHGQTMEVVNSIEAEIITDRDELIELLKGI